MKKITFIVLLFFCTMQFANAQCTNSASGFGNNTSTTMYNVQGTVQVVLNTNNTVSVNLMSNFSTAAGPDVRIFLVDRGTLTNAQLKTPSMFNSRPKIEMGMSPASGAASFTKAIPAGVTITDFDTVYFFCQQFSQFWDFGSYTPFSSSNCALLSVDDFTNNKLQFYPNPAKNEFYLNLDTSTNSYNLAIYSVLGNMVLEKNNHKNSDTPIDVSLLKAGVYFIKIIDSENTIYQKQLIIQ